MNEANQARWDGALSTAAITVLTAPSGGSKLPRWRLRRYSMKRIGSIKLSGFEEFSRSLPAYARDPLPDAGTGRRVD